MYNKTEVIKSEIKKKIDSMIEYLGKNTPESTNLSNAIEAALALTQIMDKKNAGRYLEDLDFALEQIPVDPKNGNALSLGDFAVSLKLNEEWYTRMNAVVIIVTIAAVFLFNLILVSFIVISMEWVKICSKMEPAFLFDDYLGEGLVNSIKKAFGFDTSDSIFDLLVFGKQSGHIAALSIAKSANAFFNVLNTPIQNDSEWDSETEYSDSEPESFLLI